MQRTLIVVWLFIGFASAHGQTHVLDSMGRLNVGSKVAYFRDSSRQVTINDIGHVPFKAVKGQKSPNFGFDNTPYWFRIDVVNQSDATDWLLEINFSPLDTVEFFIQDDSSKWIRQQAGDHYPIWVRDIRNRHPVFAFSIPKAATRQVYIRIMTTSSVQLPAVLWTPDVFTRVSYHLQLINGLFYGAMLLMTLYQLFLFLSVRDKVTFYYVLTLLSMTNIVSFFQGYNFLYLHPYIPDLNRVFALASGPAFLICSTLLTRALLDLKNFSRVLDYVLLINLSLDLLAGIAMLLFPETFSYKYHHYFVFSHCMIALASAAYCFSKKSRPAGYYLIAWVAPLLATASFTISNLGFIPGILSMNYGEMMTGCVLQTLFISFAIGERWNALERENRQAREKELKRNQEENERLEKEVQIRTAKIQQQNLELEEVNNVKDKLFSVVSHDIKAPLSSLHLTLTLAKAGALSPEEFKHLTAELDSRLGQTTEFIDNLLQWAKLQMKGETFEPERLNLSILASESVKLLEPECGQKGIKLVNQIKGDFEAYADINMVRSIFRNLLSNAIKFTNTEGSVTLNAYGLDNRIFISVADTGIGIPVANRDRLFTLASITTEGTSHEKGTGLGLLLCKEFVEKNGGRIWFETGEGSGTTFYFTLPKFIEAVRAQAQF